VSLASDGNSAVVGGPEDNSGAGAAWFFQRSGGVWGKGLKFVGTGAIGTARQGSSVAMSADGSTAIVGGPDDNSNTGAAWVYAYNSALGWIGQGKLVGGKKGLVNVAEQGLSVALSADGNTAIVGAPADSNQVGAAHVWVRSGTAWSEQAKLVATDYTGAAPTQGWSVALSADGNTALLGAPGNNNETGATWVFTRSGSVWTQQAELVGAEELGQGQLGRSVALSGDGTIAVVGGPNDNNLTGAAWIFQLSNGTWQQLGPKLLNVNVVDDGEAQNAQQGASVSISTDGNIAIVGAPGNNTSAGAAWVFARSISGIFQQQAGLKLVGAGYIGLSQQGSSVAVSGDGLTAMMGGWPDNYGTGAAWVFIQPQSVKAPTVTAIAPNSGPAVGGSTVTITGTNFTDATAVYFGSNLAPFTVDSATTITARLPPGSGTVNVTVVNGLSISSTSAVDTFRYWRVAHDFNGDGYSDLAWRDTTADATSGALAMWLMNGTQVTNSNAEFVTTVPYPMWTVIGNGDGNADILWRDNSGNSVIWEMMGTQIINPNAEYVANVSGWSVSGIGDFNGDGKSDILWTDGSGNYALWEMNGTQVINPSAEYVGNVSGWSVSGIGDFNGDGMSDILWTDGKGNYALWEMNGTQIINPNTEYVANVSGWSVVRIADFNGDGMSDILWTDGSGNYAMWEMGGTQVINPGGEYVGNVTGWSVTGTGDFNGDGMSDILWTDGSGNYAMWEMGGTQVINPGAEYLANVTTNWAVQLPLGE
jgi:IPT/TIG domain/FG-GAP-like repeat/FG-GAP repeat